jgi:SMC interacting uncharacterized protein involved in chromosome segregation
MEYPHTTINADLSTLARELRARDLTDLANKAESALSQYRKKKQFYTGRIEELSVRADYARKHEFLFRELGSRL